MNVSPDIEESWKVVLQNEFEKKYIKNLKQFLTNEKEKYQIFPKGTEIFNAFNSTPFHKLKVVILGQDPYHGEGQAHGLSFSVPKGVKTPPSLVNIFKEIEEDLKINNHGKGDLTKWAEQGVLLLNATLTVRSNMAGSHQNKGWEQFTDKVISTISEEREGIIFLLWGRFAQNKSKLIEKSKHHILMSSHPSPLSSYRGFLGCKHFSECNEILKRKNKTEINWQL
ncbi:MAG: uracil-DNA glycosylase [Flavobacteriales bacterium]|jgi:uracil-DNA glycosylase|nr:uracil-DNA glycosylase [Flavobacteriales bacterium]MBT6014077.1 uracil-DNA glycosylase [Flavobacteriales bacterium]MBT7481348.1 uracil-DNA glycosylase [Flavobacteriales bacterium]